MSKVVDLSWARPGYGNIKAKGYVGVMRYLSYDNTGKTVTLSEANEIRGNGLQLGLVWESTASRAKSGYDAGKSDAAEALRQANALGHTGAIYYAVDYDAPESDQPAINDYGKAFNETIGANRVGCYAGYWPLKRLFDAGLIAFGWQTLAWSGGNREQRAHLYQNGGTDFNGGVDVNDVLQDNWGQTPAGATPTPTPSPAPAPSQDGTYTVQRNDTLSGIASKFGTTWQNLAAINGIANPDLIYPGQVLHVGGSPAPTPAPAPNANGATYTVVANDTLSAIGAKFGIDYHLIAQANGIVNLDKIYPGQVLRIPGGGAPTPAAHTYTVVANDNLSGIAAKFGTSWQRLAQLNALPNPDKIYPGQVLTIG